MLTTACGAPQDLSLIAIELQPVQLHPRRHGGDTLTNLR